MVTSVTAPSTPSVISPSDPSSTAPTQSGTSGGRTFSLRAMVRDLFTRLINLFRRHSPSQTNDFKEKSTLKEPIDTLDTPISELEKEIGPCLKIDLATEADIRSQKERDEKKRNLSEQHVKLEQEFQTYSLPESQKNLQEALAQQEHAWDSQIKTLKSSGLALIAQTQLSHAASAKETDNLLEQIEQLRNKKQEALNNAREEAKALPQTPVAQNLTADQEKKLRLSKIENISLNTEKYVKYIKDSEKNIKDLEEKLKERKASLAKAEKDSADVLVNTESLQQEIKEIETKIKNQKHSKTVSIKDLEHCQNELNEQLAELRALESKGE